MANALLKKRRISPWPFRLLIFSIFIEYIRPQEMLSVLGTIRLPGLVALALFLYWFRAQSLSSIFNHRLLKLNALFIFLIGFSVLYSNNTYLPMMRFIQSLWKLLSFIMPLLLIVDSWQKFLSLLKAWVVIHGLLALWVITHGGVGTGGFLSDENDVALALGMGLPYAVYLFADEANKTWKFILAGSAILMLFGVAYSFSRGGFLGLLAVLAMMFLLSEKKIKYASMGAILVLVFGSMLISLLPASYFEEMETSTDYQSGTGNQRMISWSIGLQMFYDNPLWGVGAENYPWNVAEYQHYSSMWNPAMRSLAGRQAHSLYFTLIPELGLIGSTVYLSMIVILLRRLRGVMKRYKHDSNRRDYVLVAKAIFISIVGYLTAGAFISVLYYPHFGYFLAITLAFLKLLEVDENQNASRQR